MSINDVIVIILIVLSPFVFVYLYGYCVGYEKGSKKSDDYWKKLIERNRRG